MGSGGFGSDAAHCSASLCSPSRHSAPSPTRSPWSAFGHSALPSWGRECWVHALVFVSTPRPALRAHLGLRIRALFGLRVHRVLGVGSSRSSRSSSSCSLRVVRAPRPWCSGDWGRVGVLGPSGCRPSGAGWVGREFGIRALRLRPSALGSSCGSAVRSLARRALLLRAGIRTFRCAARAPPSRPDIDPH